MLRSASNSDKVQPSFADPKNAADLRAQRVWRFVFVVWMTWIFFSGFFILRGYSNAAVVCFVESVLYLGIVVLCRNQKSYRTIMNLNLGVSGVGLFLVGLSDPAIATTILFFPISIMIASQLLGVRDAFHWFVTSVIVLPTFFYFSHQGQNILEKPYLDELTIMIVIAACIFFCCQQGEQFYQERTKDLFELSRNLRKKSERLRQLASTDALTGLMNRFRFQERLKEAVSYANANNDCMALFLVDMDGFKEVNDTLGHPVGDAALIEIAARLQNEFGERADVARLGGDEFCIIYPSIEKKDAEKVAAQIEKVLGQRYVLHQDQFNLGASIGFAFCPDDTASDQDLLAYADTAMFFAKDNILGHARHKARMTDVLVERRTTQEQLSVALEQDEFFLVYQPQVNFASGRVIGVEALLRWRCNGTIIPPFQFIHLLEQSREIIHVSQWIINEACRQLSVWQAKGFDVNISVNVSAVQFKDPDFCRTIVDSIAEYDVDPSKLDFEITEGLLIDDVPEATAKLMRIKSLGSSVSIDDFGTGYSSLAYLRNFPIDRLKIDRAFVKDIPDSDDGVIAASIVVLAKTLGLKVLAEGVETIEQIEFLQEQDCDEYQGYYFSKPVSPEEVEACFERELATVH